MLILSDLAAAAAAAADDDNAADEEEEDARDGELPERGPRPEIDGTEREETNDKKPGLTDVHVVEHIRTVRIK